MLNTTSATLESKVQHSGLLGSLQSMGRIKFVILALKAYEQAEMQRLPEMQRLSYLYELDKQCRKWLKDKEGKQSYDSVTRKMWVDTLRDEIAGEMAINFGHLWQALGAFNQNKSNNAFNGQATGPKGVYVHESSLYAQKKQSGAFSPAVPRMTASSTLLRPEMDQLGATSHRNHKAFMKAGLRGRDFDKLTEKDFFALDRVCQGQINVLYLSKVQRLEYMVLFANGLITHPDGSPVWFNPTETVWDDMGNCAYAVDKYGSLFVMANVRQQGVQINHTTFCAGGEVLCAGTLSIKRGRLLGITNDSGHYKPTTDNLRNVLQMLKDEGIPIDNVYVNDTSRSLHTKGRQFMAGDYKSLPADFVAGLKAQIG